jgi:hypothetical protein
MPLEAKRIFAVTHAHHTKLLLLLLSSTHASVAAVQDVRKFSPAADLVESGCDVVVGGPPCQGFSIGGHMRTDDCRSVGVCARRAPAIAACLCHGERGRAGDTPLDFLFIMWYHMIVLLALFKMMCYTVRVTMLWQRGIIAKIWQECLSAKLMHNIYLISQQ